MKITAEWTIGEIIRIYPGAEQILACHGLRCLGCPAADGESLLTAAVSHGLSLDGILAELNNLKAD
ncbi:MAG: DUF1858 domain-containing protein [Bacillota bacterium]